MNRLINRSFILKWALLFLLSLFNEQVYADIMDPTRPPTEIPTETKLVASSSSLAVQMIIIEPKRKLAVINGATYHEGDVLGSYIVKGITPNCVVFSQANGENLRLCTLEGFKE